MNTFIANGHWDKPAGYILQKTGGTKHGSVHYRCNVNKKQLGKMFSSTPMSHTRNNLKVYIDEKHTMLIDFEDLCDIQEMVRNIMLCCHSKELENRKKNKEKGNLQKCSQPYI